MPETSIDRARRLLPEIAADQLADLFPKITLFVDGMDDKAFVGLCLTLLSANMSISQQAQVHGYTEAAKRGRFRHAGQTYRVTPA